LLRLFLKKSNVLQKKSQFREIIEWQMILRKVQVIFLTIDIRESDFKGSEAFGQMLLGELKLGHTRLGQVA
jgi:hypothetical protein